MNENTHHSVISSISHDVLCLIACGANNGDGWCFCSYNEYQCGPKQEST